MNMQLMSELYEAMEGFVQRTFDSLKDKTLSLEHRVSSIETERADTQLGARLVFDIADEISRGLSGGFEDLSYVPGTGLNELAESVKSLEKTLRAPIIPIYDENGEFKEARRAD